MNMCQQLQIKWSCKSCRCNFPSHTLTPFFLPQRLMLPLSTKWRMWEILPLWSAGINRWLPSPVCYDDMFTHNQILITVTPLYWTAAVSSPAQAIASSTRRQWRVKARSWISPTRPHLWLWVTSDLGGCTTSVSTLWRTAWRVSPSSYRSTPLEIHCQVIHNFWSFS